MKRKRIWSLLWVLLFCASLFSPVMAEEPAVPVLKLESADALCGDECVLAVTLEENPGFAGLKLTLTFDASKLSLAEPEHPENCVTLGEAYAKAFSYFEVKYEVVEGTGILTAGMVRTENVTAIGTLFFIRLKALEGLGNGQTAVSLSAEGCYVDAGQQTKDFDTIAATCANVTGHTVRLETAAGTILWDSVPKAAFTAKVTAAAGEKVVLAAYDAAGRMLSVTFTDADGTVAAFGQTDNRGGSIQTVKVFRLGSGNIPNKQAAVLAAAG